MRSWRACSALFLLPGLVARAEPPLPSYREELVVAAWEDLDRAITDACVWPRGQEGLGVPLSCEPARLDEVILRASLFLDRVVPDGRIRYLVGLAHRHKGELHQAQLAFRDAVRLSPDRAEAWFDLGELLAGQQDWDGARAAFEEVTRLVPEGTRSWPGWFQLAQVDAAQRRPEALEVHLRSALRHGFSFRLVTQNPAWRRFYADPELRPVLERLVSVYAEPEVRKALEQPLPE